MNLYSPNGMPASTGVAVSGQIYTTARQACANLIRMNAVPPDLANTFMNDIIGVQNNGQGGISPANPAGFNHFFERLYSACPGLVNGAGASVQQITDAIAPIIDDALEALSRGRGGRGDILIGANTANIPTINNNAHHTAQPVSIVGGVTLRPLQPQAQAAAGKAPTMAVAPQVLAADHADLPLAEIHLVSESPDQVGAPKFITVDWSYKTTNTQIPVRGAKLTLNIPFGNRYEAFRAVVAALPPKALDGKYLYLVDYSQAETIPLALNNYSTAINSARNKDGKLLPPADIIAGLRETLTSRAYEVLDERIVADINAGLYAFLRDGYSAEKFAIDKLVDVCELLDHGFTDPLVTQFKGTFFETVSTIASSALSRYLDEESVCTNYRGISSVVASETTFIDNSGKSKYDLIGASEGDSAAFMTALSAKQTIIRASRTFIITNLLSVEAQNVVFNGGMLTPRQLPTMNALVRELDACGDFNQFDYTNLYCLCDKEHPGDLLLEAVLSTTLHGEIGVIPYLRQPGY